MRVVQKFRPRRLRRSPRVNLRRLSWRLERQVLARCVMNVTAKGLAKAEKDGLRWRWRQDVGKTVEKEAVGGKFRVVRVTSIQNFQ